MNPGQGLVHEDGPAGGGSRYPGSADGIGSGRNIHAQRRDAQTGMQIAAGRAAAGYADAGRAVATAFGAAGRNERRDEWSERDQTEPLMDLEHVRPPVEPRLVLGAPLGDIRWEPEIPQRRRLRVAGRSRRRRVLRRGRWIAVRLR